MKIIRVNEINGAEILKSIKEGKIFIYPTDTIYGLGCDAENKDSVEKIKQIKLRDKNKPLSVIAPSLKWIEENLIIDVDLKKYLPGPYTLILKKKNIKFLDHVSSTDSLGVRIPDNEFTKVIQKSKVPFITTSVNVSGESPIEQISDVSEKIKNKVVIIVDAGKLKNRPSTLVINGKEIIR